MADLQRVNVICICLRQGRNDKSWSGKNFEVVLLEDKAAKQFMVNTNGFWYCDTLTQVNSDS